MLLGIYLSLAKIPFKANQKRGNWQPFGIRHWPFAHPNRDQTSSHLKSIHTNASMFCWMVFLFYEVFTWKTAVTANTSGAKWKVLFSLCLRQNTLRSTSDPSYTIQSIHPFNAISERVIDYWQNKMNER